MDFSFMIIIAEGTIAVNSFPSFYLMFSREVSQS